MKLNELREIKGKKKLVMLTAYDWQMARILDEAEIDLILVGDSLGMVIQGYRDTKKVTMQDMLYHMRAVARGAKHTPVIGDMPIRSARTVKDALRNARRFVESGAQGVKVEGNKPEIIRVLLDAGIPVMGHVGLLPQTAESHRVKGKQPTEARTILSDARELDRLGVFSMVLECIPEALAGRITRAVMAPTIGIGAGKFCDGQVLVTNDILGYDQGFAPKYLKRYANLNKTIKRAIAKFQEEVLSGLYPDNKHTYH
ncbi:MAG: 3-methyl-2-oxobutanoate hydroxymethyltransferase [Candidatus Bathyarchaeota archaeon]|jgi:3-methyl-2-oxobutanoate hydroxymethyltransferase|nr:MAG: 3-methyl-2-oxobutanoate hydroxymethyltransferase [Candidatus Bathyarchaeota archaeon]